jgi:peptide/nickel transport system permease protein
MIPTLLIIITLSFLLIHLAPGDPIQMYTGNFSLSAEARDALLRRYGLDQPLPVQYFNYLSTLAQGDLGKSLLSGRPVLEMIGERLPATLLLSLTSSILAFLGGNLLAILTARRRRLDASVSLITYILYSMPTFWLGIILIIIFATQLNWFPTSGYMDVREQYTGFRRILDVAHHLVLPAATLLLVTLPGYYRVARASIGDVRQEDFMTTLRAAGLPSGMIFRRYALKNALLPSITLFGLSLGYALAGAALVEIVFAWPGIGRLTLDAVFRRDYPVLMGIYLIIAISVMAAILLTDLIYAFVDPRIRYQRS